MIVILLAMLLSASASVESSLEDRVSRLVRESGADVAVAFRTLDGKQELFLQPDVSYHAASTMKVPVMIELFQQAREGRVKLEDPLLISTTFRSIVDGSPYQLHAEDDSESELYAAAGESRTLIELCRQMITRSSNLATNLLIEKLGPENIQRTTDRLGAEGMHVLRGVEDGKAYEKGLNNTTTARALLQLLEKIARLEAVDAASSGRMIEILKAQQFNEGIPSGLPEGIEVAHKTGEITKIHHDAAIVFAQRPFILVLLVRGLEDQKDSARLMGKITKVLYESLDHTAIFNRELAGDDRPRKPAEIPRAAETQPTGLLRPPA